MLQLAVEREEPRGAPTLRLRDAPEFFPRWDAALQATALAAAALALATWIGG